MQEQIQKYLEAIKSDYAGWNEVSKIRKEMVTQFNAGLTIVPGNKYIKVVSKGSVHSFIVAQDTPKFKRGDVLKAKSWKAPATNFARGNLLSDNFNFEAVRWTGA